MCVCVCVCEYVFVLASFPVSTPSFFSHEPGQICHVKCVISAGSVCDFVECSDLATLHKSNS